MNKKYLALDVGARRIGVAIASDDVRAAWPLTTVVVDGTEASVLKKIIDDNAIDEIIIGRPINQSGRPTAQTESVETFVATVVKPLGLPIHWQEESVTSVIAEQRLQDRGQPYDRAAIDAEAAAIILQDFLEAKTHG